MEDAEPIKVVNWVEMHTVTFNADNETAATTAEVGDGTAVSVPDPAPTKAGYVFGGWQLNGEAYDFETPVTADMTLTALWLDNTWTMEPITAGSSASADGKKLTYTNITVDYSPINNSNGRLWVAAWVGAKVIAPESVTTANLSTVKYDRDGNTGVGTDNMSAKSFASGNDGVVNGHYYMEVWVPLTAENVRSVLAGQGTIYRSYSFYFELHGGGESGEHHPDEHAGGGRRRADQSRELG